MAIERFVMAEYFHIPVMKEEVLRLLDIKPDKIYLDATLGGGGHSRGILERGGIVIAIDLDEEAIRNSMALKEQYKDRFFAFRGNFRDAVDIIRRAGFERVDGVVMDLGISSFQVDNPLRGFSFLKSGPINMRFDGDDSFSTYNYLKKIKLQDLADAFEKFADLRKAKEIARYVKSYFEQNMPDDTLKFAEYLRGCKALPRSRRIDPVTRVFMAIRMLVNNEVENINGFFTSLPMIVKPGAVVVVIAFHSVEDRLVKNFFKDFTKKRSIDGGGLNLTARLINKKVILPSREEVSKNPRSRSARLRAITFLASD